jgi:hypothetical protein
MIRLKFVKMSLVLILIYLLTGCATFKSDLKGKYIAPAEKNYEADRVSVLFIFSHFRQTKGLDAIPKLDNQYERIRGFDDFFQDALNEFSNVKNYATFTEYAADVNDPARRAQKDSLIRSHDYIIKIKFKREKSFAKNFLGSITSSVSLTLLPIPYTYSYSVSAEVYDSQLHLLKNYSRSASLTKWVQTFLILAYPFHPEQRKKEELYVQFLHDIFKQIESEKTLKTDN